MIEKNNIGINKGNVAVTDDDRQRFFELTNKDGVSWEEFWKHYDNDDVMMLLFYGG